MELHDPQTLTLKDFLTRHPNCHILYKSNVCDLIVKLFNISFTFAFSKEFKPNIKSIDNG